MPTPIRVSRFGFVNAYLVQESDGLTLVDTGIPGMTKSILAAAERLGAGIRRIALTHGHGDHVGCVDSLVTALADVEVLISTRDARLLEKDKSLDPGEPQSEIKGGVPGIATKPTATFAAGDRIGSLEVVAAPGHTPGHVAFLDMRDRTLYCGDTFTSIGGVRATNKLRVPFPLAAMATWHGPTELASAKALRALNPARLAPGHGQVVESPLEAMDVAIAKAS